MMTIGQKLAKTAQEALERLAEDEFSKDKILAACQVAAAQGFTSCEISPSILVDVSQTEAIKEVGAVLKKQWLELTWQPRAVPGERAYKVLQVSWGVRKA